MPAAPDDAKISMSEREKLEPSPVFLKTYHTMYNYVYIVFEDLPFLTIYNTFDPSTFSAEHHKSQKGLLPLKPQRNNFSPKDLKIFG